MNTYTIMRNSQAERFENFPKMTLATDEDFARCLEEHNFSDNPDDEDYIGKQLLALENDQYILRSDKEALEELLASFSDELSDLIAGDKTGKGFITDMFYTELCVSGCKGAEDNDAIADTLMALNMTMEHLEKSAALSAGLQNALSLLIQARKELENGKDNNGTTD